MKQHSVPIVCREGLHLRPAAQLVKLSHRFDADLSLRAGARVADARSIFELLLLGAGPGTRLVVEATGDDASAAVEAAAALLGSEVTSHSAEFVASLLPGPGSAPAVGPAGAAA